MTDVTDSESELLEWRDRALAAEAQLHRLREIGTAALEELDTRLVGLELHPATPGLAGVFVALRRLRSSVNPREDRPAPALSPCDLAAVIERCLAAYPTCRFDNRCSEPLRGWLDAGLLANWVDAALELLGEPGQITLVARAARQGQLLVRLELDGRGSANSLILQQYALRLAHRMNARMGAERSAEHLAVDLELELVLAAPS